MWRRVREPFGKAGLAVAVVALVAAMVGGAYAASGGLSGKQKKEVKKIAKEFAGKPGAPGVPGAPGTKGDTGATGANGAPGIKGDKGDAGEQGKQGEQGKEGKGVQVFKLLPGDPNCPEGGTKFVSGTGVESFACNGGSSTGSFPDTLPTGKTETGIWNDLGESGLTQLEFAETPVSFPLRLAAPPIESVFIGFEPSEEDLTKCPGEEAEPKATPGVFCLYLGGATGEIESHVLQSVGAIGMNVFLKPKAAKAFGSWAVMAE